MTRAIDTLRVLKLLSQQPCKVQNLFIYKTLGIDRRKSQLILKDLVSQGFITHDNGSIRGYRFNMDFNKELS